ncbi:MAG: SpoIIE family protein phosphatase [Candidatus Borkfalkiaceae bacterium]|nr:SpoIIE family protein phosphatase [Clostridia bacterium]MDY6224067.1 SpoIIE family protein phosphatase [Christensenellaceae bacterium]
MKESTYQKILGKIPAGVFVFNEKLQILYANPSFLRAFSAQAVSFAAAGNKRFRRLKKAALKDILSCPAAKTSKRCGEDGACEYCSLFKAMHRAAEESREETDVAYVTADKGNRTETLTTRVRVFPLSDNKRKDNGKTDENQRGRKTKRGLFLGITDGAVQTELAREMLTAKRMQQRLLPAGKQTGGVAYSYMYIPSLEIGGDLPDVYEFGGRVFGVLSDVSGKGISAGMLSAFIRAGFNRRELSVAKAISSLKEKFEELNQDERSYITVAAVSIDRETRLLRYVLAGHNAPILLRSGRGLGINEIEDPAPPVSNWIENYEYVEKHMSYEPGDLLVLLSDGVTECPNTAGERFGIERVESVLMQSAHAEDFIGKLKNALTVFSGGKFTDDITAMAFDLV